MMRLPELPVQQGDSPFVRPSRRALLLGAGHGLAAAGLMGLSSPAMAQDSDATDPRISTETVAYNGAKATLKGYLARPKTPVGKRPGVVLIHEVRGINAHFRDLARRLAVEGFIAFVPDLVAAQNYPQEGSDEVRDYLQKLTVPEAVGEYQVAIDALAKVPECSGAIGIVGFVWGGPIAAQLAALPSKPLKAAVLYYSLPTSLDVVSRFNAAVLLQYAEQDPRTQPQIDLIEKRLIGNSKVYEQYVYEGAKPNFANESLPKWYNKPQADLAWDRTIMFLKRQLV